MDEKELKKDIPFDWLSEIDMRLDWLKGLADLLMSQGELVDSSIYPTRESISNTGWLIENIVDDIKSYSDMLSDALARL